MSITLFKYTTIKIPQLVPTTYTAQEKVHIFRRLQEMVQINHDMKWTNNDKIIKQIF